MKLIHYVLILFCSTTLFSTDQGFNAKATQELTDLFKLTKNEAITSGRVEDLILQGADPSTFPESLLWAVKSGDIALCELLLGRGVSVDAITEKWGRTTPLFYAAGNRDYKMCEFLIAHGADVNAQNEGGATPLTWATLFEGDLAICELLIKHGAQVQPVTHNLLPLLIAAMNGNLEICELLLDTGADIDAISGGATAFGMAAQIALESEKVCSFLLERGANVNERNENGATALMALAYDGNLTMCQLLIAYGADVHAIDNNGFTPLIICCNPKSFLSKPDSLFEVAKHLLEKGADVHAMTDKGDTALHLAADHDLIKSVTLLLAHGADPLLQNNKGETPLSLAKKHNRKEILQLLESHFCHN